MDLTTQHMEYVRGSSAVNDLHVTILNPNVSRWFRLGIGEGVGGYLMLTVDFIFRGEDTGILVAELEEPFNTTRRMFWSLSIVSMGQTQHQPRSLLPL